MMNDSMHVRFRARADVLQWPSWIVRASLLIVEGFSGVSAIAGGIGLIVHGLGIPESLLDGTPFDSFVVPGVLLAGVVGGSMLGAVYAVWKHHPLSGFVSMGAGAILLGWITVEALMVHDGRALQVIYAVLAIAIIFLGWMHRHTQRPPRGAQKQEPVL